MKNSAAGNARRLCWWAAALLLLQASSAGPQSAEYPGPQPPHGPFDTPSLSESDPAFAARRLKALNEDRQKSMVNDTQKLLTLARTLDTAIHHHGDGAPTPVELREVADIEKLARSVKQKMSLAVGNQNEQQIPLLPLDH